MGGNERKIPGVRGFGEKKRTRGEEVGGLQGEAIGEALGGDKVYLTLEMMASVNCEVEPFPPKSPVMALPSAMVCVCAEQTSAFSIQTPQYQSPPPPRATHVKDGLFNVVGVFEQVHVPQHHHRGQQQGGRVGQSLSGDIRCGTVNGLEDGSVLSNVTRWRQTETSDETGTHVGQDVSVQVGHDHDGVGKGSWVGSDLHVS